MIITAALLSHSVLQHCHIFSCASENSLFFSVSLQKCIFRHTVWAFLCACTMVDVCKNSVSQLLYATKKTSAFALKCSIRQAFSPRSSEDKLQWASMNLVWSALLKKINKYQSLCLNLANCRNSKLQKELNLLYHSHIVSKLHSNFLIHFLLCCSIIFIIYFQSIYYE